MINQKFNIMRSLSLYPNSTATFSHDILGSDLPLQFSIQTPTICSIEIDDHLCKDKKLLLTKGREITIKIQY